jgi:signal transduction histidine kinase
LLLLTILFVMIAEIAIYVPSIANFRMNWLRDRLAAAHTAVLVIDAAPAGAVPEALAQQILGSIGARAVAVKKGQERRLLAAADLPDKVDSDVDIRAVSAWSAIVDAFGALLSQNHGVIRVVGPAPAGGQFIEVVVDEPPLREAMLRYSANILWLSLIISIITASLVYFALNYLFVRPMRRITANLVGFHDNPESSTRIITPTQRQDEIGMAERELADMQRDLVSMLNQKSRLAALGLAVSKINHDLRNLLASAQLISDQLGSVDDPRVQRFAPKLMRTLERAIAYCQSTLSYGRAQEAPPVRKRIALKFVLAEVRDTLGLTSDGAIAWVDSLQPGMMIDADPDQLFRILLNLARNSVQAMEGIEADASTRREIRVSGRREGNLAVIDLSDTGPGVPAKARKHLFEAFQGSVRAGGTGLGLAIAAELVRAHGGDIKLMDVPQGATFRITIPDQAAVSAPVRGKEVAT